MVVMAHAQTACRATARVARTRTREGMERDRVLVRATLAVALGASSRDISYKLNKSYLDAYGTTFTASAIYRFPLLSSLWNGEGNDKSGRAGSWSL